MCVWGGDYGKDDNFELCVSTEIYHPPKTIKTDHFTKDWLVAALNYFISLGRDHEWSFGAIAQLLDNAKDAQATKYGIFFLFPSFCVANIFCAYPV